MFLIILLVLAALGLAATAEVFSVVGLATTYAGSFNSVVALGCAIGLGKLVSVSFLYRFWDRLTVAFRSVLIVIITSMMLITSFGTFGFLTKANQTDMIGLKQTTVTQKLLQDEAARLEARKLQIDQQVAQLKPEDVQGRVRLNRQFKDELKEINTRLPQIAKEKATLASEEITQQADIGPLVYLAKSMGLDVDIATTWFTLLLVIVLDPAAVILTICVNIAIAHHQRKGTVVELPVATPVPQTPATGTIRFNEPANAFEMFDGTDWRAYKPHDDNATEEPIEPPGLVVTGTLNAAVPHTGFVAQDVAPMFPEAVEAVNPPVDEPDVDTTSPAIDRTVTDLTSMNWVPDPVAVAVPEPVVMPAVVEFLSKQPVSQQTDLDFNAPLIVEEQPSSGTLRDPYVARMALEAVLKDAPEHINKQAEDNADGLLEEVAIAQGPQPVVDTTGIAPNTFGQPNKAAWDNFVDVSNSLANNRDLKNQQEFKTHLAQLQAYVDELDGRNTPVSDDEAALRSRIIAFIQRHQPS